MSENSIIKIGVSLFTKLDLLFLYLDIIFKFSIQSRSLLINILILEAKIINHNIVSKKLFYSLDFKTEVNNDDHTIMVKELNLLKKI